MRMEYGFTYGKGQRSPSIEPDYDEDDGWWDAFAEEIKESLWDIPTETIQVIESTDHVPSSSVDTMGEPRGDQHITMSSSLVVEASGDVPVSTTMSTSTAMDEARNEINALRKELASTRKHSSQVQQLLEEDSEAHPSNRQARADRADLNKTKKELSELHATHWITESELERAKDINDKSIVENHALNRSVLDRKSSCGSLQMQLEAKTKELATPSTAMRQKTKSWRTFARGSTTMSSRTQRTTLVRTDTKRRTIPCVRTLKRCVRSYSRPKKTST